MTNSRNNILTHQEWFHIQMMKEGHRLPQASEDVAKAPKNNKYKLNI